MPIHELRSIATFAKAVELGSLRRAAEAQGITPQAASQALGQLEQHLGVRLLHRTTRRISLTDEGRQFLDDARPALAGLQRAMAGVRRSREDVAGPLRIVGPRSTFLPVLWPVLDEFCRLHPEVQPDVQLDDRIGNWVEDRVDVGFRVGASAAEGVIARRLLPVQLIVCAAPSYLARHGAPATVAELAAHRCAAFRNTATGQVLPWFLKSGDAVVAHDVSPAICTNEEDLETAAVLAGQAIGLITNITAAAHVRAGRLVPLLSRHAAERAHLFVYYGSRAAQPARARAFIELVVKRLADNPAYVLGAKELAAAERKGVRAHARA